MRTTIVTVLGAAVLLTGATGVAYAAAAGTTSTVTQSGNSLPIDNNHAVVAPTTSSRTADDRGTHRISEPGDERGTDRASEPGDDRGTDRTSEPGDDRGTDRTAEPGDDRGTDQNSPAVSRSATTAGSTPADDHGGLRRGGSSGRGGSDDGPGHH
jgi:hypothetical protein